MNERYARHALIPDWDQAALTRATIVIVGVGALGSEVARTLAQAGVGNLVLCDPDTVAESNLSRGALFTPADVGRPKVEVAAGALTTTVGVTVEARVDDFAHGIGLAELRDATLVVACLDSRAGRMLLGGRCSLAGAALLDAGTHPWGGEVRYYPVGGPCYGCGFSPAERALPIARVGCPPPDEAGASGPISALIGAWQATQALRLLLGLEVPQGVVRVDPVGGDSRRVAVRRDPDCPFHGRIEPAQVVRTELTADSPVAELLALAEPGEHPRSWHPIDRSDPLASDRLDQAGPGRTLRELGIPPGELLPLIRARPSHRVRFVELARPRRNEAPTP